MEGVISLSPLNSRGSISESLSADKYCVVVMVELSQIKIIFVKLAVSGYLTQLIDN